MRQIAIRKELKKQGNEEIEVFIVPAMVIPQADGKAKKIPHPDGTDIISFSSMEKALKAIEMAGYSDSTYNISYSGATKNDIHPSLTNVSAHLIKTLNDKSKQVIASAIFALGEMGDTEAIKPLISFIGDDDSNIRNNTIEALAKIGIPAISELIKTLDDENWEKRNSAVLCLGEMTKYKYVDLIRAVNPLLDKLNDNNPIVRSSSAITLGKIYNTLSKLKI